MIQQDKFDSDKFLLSPQSISMRDDYINYFIQYWIAMSKLLKKDHSPLKFDTSSANINCFIRPQSKQKHSDSDQLHHTHKNKKKTRNQYHTQLEFQDKAFLQSVVSKIFTDADCPGITELIDNMVFPSANSGETEANRDNRKQQLQQQEMSLIFSNSHPLIKGNFTRKGAVYEQNHELYRLIPPQFHFNRDQKQEMTATFHTSFNSYSPNPKIVETNPEIQMLNMNPSLYPYAYYSQSNYAYPRQQSPRKRRIVTGEQAQEFRIVPEKVEADYRTTLMIRHIPNKYSEDMLLQQIGKNHRMHINFLYLPIDHYNSCNVGYAFANFIHTKFILEFYKQFNGRRWDRFNSEKICELAYARIQGTTNLMDHFQNSSNGQLRGRALSKGQERKKTSVQLDDNAIKDISKIVNHQRVEDN